jgi:peptidyl-prolyl cis-trans isomerase A (cyclophilin A)
MKGGALMPGIRRWLLLVLPAVIFAEPALTGEPGAQKSNVRKPGLYAVFDTSMGKFACELLEKAAPLTVANFVGLAQGTKEWLTPKGEFVKKPFYDGLLFHRVVKKFMIQAGDVSGTGANFPAVIPFEDEIVKTLTFDRPGMLAMANNGTPKSNTTQFFVTVAPAPHLNGRHTIFGRVVEGMNVVEAISNVPLFVSKPSKDVVLKKVTIERVGGKAK